MRQVHDKEADQQTAQYQEQHRCQDEERAVGNEQQAQRHPAWRYRGTLADDPPEFGTPRVFSSSRLGLEHRFPPSFPMLLGSEVGGSAGLLLTCRGPCRLVRPVKALGGTGSGRNGVPYIGAHCAGVAGVS